MVDSNVKPNGIQEVKEDWKDVRNKAGDTAHSAVDLAKDAASAVKDAASSAAEKAKSFASATAEKAKETASAVGEKANDYTAAAGSKIKQAGEAIVDKGPHEGMLGSATKAVGETVQKTGAYLEDAKLDGIGKDLTEMIKAHPVPALLIGVGLGVLLGRATRS